MLDLLDGRFVLLAGSDGARWYEEAAPASASVGVALAAYRMGPNGDLRDPEDGLMPRLGVSSDGAALIRPDGFVAWRSRRITNGPGRLLEQVLRRVLTARQRP